MKRLLIVLALIIGIAACPPPQGDIPDNVSQQRVSHYGTIRYFQDLRTELCFAEMGYHYAHVMTNVPCTQEVLQVMRSQ
jgi:hypothetical protein